MCALPCRQCPIVNQAGPAAESTQVLLALPHLQSNNSTHHSIPMQLGHEQNRHIRVPARSGKVPPVGCQSFTLLAWACAS
jgi:hypothetical protein